MKNLKNFIVGLLIVFMVVQLNGQDLQQLDYFLFDEPAPKSSIKSWDGYHKSPNGSYGAQLDVSALPAGSYPWQIVNKNKVIGSGKWVKK